MKQAPPPSYQVAMATSIPTNQATTTEDANIITDTAAVSSVTATISEIPPPPPYISPSITSVEVNVNDNERSNEEPHDNARIQENNK